MTEAELKVTDRLPDSESKQEVCEKAHKRTLSSACLPSLTSAQSHDLDLEWVGEMKGEGRQRETERKTKEGEACVTMVTGTRISIGQLTRKHTIQFLTPNGACKRRAQI